MSGAYRKKVLELRALPISPDQQGKNGVIPLFTYASYLQKKRIESVSELKPAISSS